MQRLTVALVLAACMAAAATTALVLRPSPRPAAQPPGIVLEQAVPRQFGSWRELPNAGVALVNPQTQQLLDKLYSQLLTRTYVHENGYRIMVSLAYGDDQRGSLEAHMPEVCYPAQGFALHGQSTSELATPYGTLTLRRLATSMGQRREPVSYWFSFGDSALRSGSRFEKRLIEIRFGLTGRVPDGLLFRVSSIDPDTARGYEMQERFIRDVLAAVRPQDRARLIGLGG